MTEADCLEDTSLIKTDRLGRLRTSVHRREMLLDEYEKSGMSGAQFAAMIGIKYSTFTGWRRRRNKRYRSSSGSTKPLQLVEAVVAPRADTNHPAEGLRLHLPGGATMELREAHQVPLACALLKSLGITPRSC